MHPLIIVLIGFFIFALLEKIFPNCKLPLKKGWLLRAVFFNLIQLGIIILGNFTWERWIMGSKSMFNLDKNLNPVTGGLIAYLINTWIFYWWHRIRHENEWTWRIFHQFHHSPERIEVITAFYKHPFEVIANSIIITILLYPILGLSVEASAWFTLFSTLSEFFYHLNIKTPFWLGYIIQRPECHCLHHIRDKQYSCKNYSDLPIWDILGGTFHNITDEEFEKLKIGFSNNKEEKVLSMLLCKNVLKKKDNKLAFRTENIIFWFLLIIGSLHIMGYILNINNLKGIAFSSVASPLPLVFSASNGVETFSTNFSFNIEFKNGTIINKTMDHKLYSKLKQPYNWRNVIGVVFSHGPFFDKENMIKMRDQIFQWIFCKGKLTKEFDIVGSIKHVDILIKSKTAGNENKKWILNIDCK